MLSPININHKIKPMGIGKNMRTKINANIGTSKDRISVDDEMKKLEVLVKYGADAVMGPFNRRAYKKNSGR